MKASTRVYLVKGSGLPAPRLVRATYAHMAERHTIGALVQAQVATKDDLIALMQTGVKVEDAASDKPDMQDDAYAKQME